MKALSNMQISVSQEVLEFLASKLMYVTDDYTRGFNAGINLVRHALLNNEIEAAVNLEEIPYVQELEARLTLAEAECAALKQEAKNTK